MAIKFYFLTFVKINAMLVAFENYVKKNKLFSKEDKLLLALSGGEDSICLFHLLVGSNYRFSVAHCNFNLRGEESTKDELFVEKLAKSHRVPFFSIKFDTKKEAKKLKAGIQETARKLRYDWFHELLETYRFDKLLTAHHQGDNSETIVINLLRSTGISGLHGIPVSHNKIVRPLMFTNREKISRFIKKNDLKFRLDKSNLSDHYLRNAVRLNVMPQLKKLEPNLDEVLFSVSSQVREFEEMALELVEKQWDLSTKTVKRGLELSLESLQKIKHLETFLYYKLRDFGFNKAQISSFVSSEHSQIGKKIESEHWELILERGTYALVRKEETSAEEYKAIRKDTKKMNVAGAILHFDTVSQKKVNIKEENTLFIDISSNPFPLSIRPWKKGDRMQPLGMKGSKKISDILTDKKIENASRKDQLVIVDKRGEILVLLPHTISEACKIRKETSKVLSIHMKTP
jgi:tRNA(Ile)-lysidine synthase